MDMLKEEVEAGRRATISVEEFWEMAGGLATRSMVSGHPGERGFTFTREETVPALFQVPHAHAHAIQLPPTSFLRFS